MSFIKGFAEGFISERKRVKEREADIEDRDFKYQMEELTRQRTKRDEQKEKEKQWKMGAETVAQSIGDPSFQSIAYRQLAAGRSVDALLDDYNKGYWKKDPNYVQPDKTIRVPSAISMESPELEAGGALEEQPVDTSKMSFRERGEARRAQERKERVQSRIRDVAPNLLAEQEEIDRQAKVQNDNYTPVDTGGWTFKRSDEYKVGNMKDALWKRAQAIQNKDPAALRVAEQEIDVIRAANTLEARDKARAEGKNVQTFAYMENGRMKTVLTGEIEENEDGTRSVRNISDPNLPQEVRGANTLMVLPEEGVKAYLKLGETVGTRSKELQEGVNSYTSALNTSTQMLEILERNPGVTTNASAIVNMAANAADEVKGVWQAIQNQKNKTEMIFQQGGTKEEKFAKLEAEAEKFEELVEQALSPQNRALADDKAVYELLKVSATFQFAKAQGMGGRDVSDADYRNMYKAIGGDGRPEVVEAALRTVASNTLSYLDSARKILDKDPSIMAFETTYLGGKKGSSGFSGDFLRVEQHLIDMGYDKKNPKMFQFFKSIDAGNRYGAAAAGATIQGMEPSQETQKSDPLSQARDAIARGANREAVIKRLEEHGINPEGL